MAYVNLIATGIVFNIRASSSHIGRMVAFSEHRRWIISVFDRRSIMNRLYWHDQQVGYVCFVPFVWEQRGVIAAVADQTAMISHLLPMCWATRWRSWGHVMKWARFGSQGSIALNWHSRYSGTRYSGTWLYILIAIQWQIFITMYAITLSKTAGQSLWRSNKNIKFYKQVLV